MSGLKFVPLAALAVLLGTGTARADGPAPAAPHTASPASTPVAVDGTGAAIDFFGVTRFFSAPSSLGDAWEHAVQAVLDSMRTYFEAERVVVVTATPPSKRNVVWPAPPPREVGDQRQLVKLHPVLVEPVTRTVGDVRGQSALLLGGSVELPWMMP
jgi:hypothetical protein